MTEALTVHISNSSCEHNVMWQRAEGRRIILFDLNIQIRHTSMIYCNFTQCEHIMYGKNKVHSKDRNRTGL